MYAVFREESDFEVKNEEIRQLDVKNEEKRNEENPCFPLRFLVFPRNSEDFCYDQKITLNKG